MSQEDLDPNTCPSCGVGLRAGDRFCRGCGYRQASVAADGPASSSDVADASSQPTQPSGRISADGPPTSPPGYPSQPPPPSSGQAAGWYPTAPGGYPGQPAGPPGYPAQAYPTPPAGYAAQPPGYPPPPGYAMQPGPGAQLETGTRSPDNAVWLVTGVLVAVLAVVAIGVGIYFAASSGGGGQASLVAAPATSSVTTSASSSSPASSSNGSAGSRSGGSLSTPGAGSTSAVQTGAIGARAASSHVARIGQSSEGRAVADTIQRHFSLIQQHQFSAAYAILAPSLQSGESSWVQSHREDGIYQVSVAVDAKVHSSDSATATIIKMQTLDTHGCKDWSGGWGLTKISGQWRISESNLSFTSCGG